MAKRISILMAVLMVVGLAGEAFALDGWRDRRGLFFGVGFGGGMGQAKTDKAEGDRELGLNINARVGGGVNKRLTLDFDLGMHFQSADQQVGASTVEVNTQITSGMIGANFFLADGLYLRGMGGMGHYSTEPEKGSGDSEVGLGLGIGAGYEFFANADLAVGFGADYRRLFFEVNDVDVDYDMINFGITATWY